MTSNFISFMSLIAVLVLNALAPAPTGSSNKTWPSSDAFRPALNMLVIVRELRVPIFIFNPLQI